MTPATPEKQKRRRGEEEKGRQSAPRRFVARIRGQAEFVSPLLPCSSSPLLYGGGAGVGRERQGKPWTRRGALLALCAALLYTVGCGGNAFTGGSVPIGKSRVQGQVIHSEYPNQPIINTLITIVASTTSRDTQTFQQYTDQNGRFDFPDIPTDQYSGRVQITLDPDDTVTRSQQLSFLVANGHGVTLIAALPRLSFDINQANSLVITPPLANLRAGDKIKFTAEVRDAADRTLPVTPTLLFSDDFGTLASNGVFVSKGAGTGTLSAFWYNNLKTTASVIVSANNNLPPPPPNPTD